MREHPPCDYCPLPADEVCDECNDLLCDICLCHCYDPEPWLDDDDDDDA